MPGHTQSWLVGYPELGSAAGETPGLPKDSGLPMRPSTQRASAPTSFSTLFWGRWPGFSRPLDARRRRREQREGVGNPRIKAFMLAHGMKTTAELQAYFSARVQKILEKHHKRMVGWDEILSPTLPRDAVIQNWHGIEFLSMPPNRAIKPSCRIRIIWIRWTRLPRCSSPIRCPPMPASRRNRQSSFWAAKSACGASRWFRRRSTRASGRGQRPSPSASGRRLTTATSTTCTAAWESNRFALKRTDRCTSPTPPECCATSPEPRRSSRSNSLSRRSSPSPSASATASSSRRPPQFSTGLWTQPSLTLLSARTADPGRCRASRRQGEPLSAGLPVSLLG